MKNIPSVRIRIKELETNPEKKPSVSNLSGLVAKSDRDTWHSHTCLTGLTVFQQPFFPLQNFIQSKYEKEKV